MIHQALIRFENYQPAFLQIRLKELCEAAETWAKAAEKPADPPTMPPHSENPTATLQLFFMTDIALAQRLEHFLEGTWTGSKRIQGLQGGARALAAGATGGTRAPADARRLFERARGGKFLRRS